MSKSNYLKKLEEIKGKAYGTSSKDDSSDETDSNSKENNTSSQSILDRIKKNAGMDDSATDIDFDYINSFIADTNTFLGTAEKEYSKMGWANASAYYNSRSESYTDLSERYKTINKWLAKNSNNLDEETYSSLKDTLTNAYNGINSVYNDFRDANDTFSKFKSEDEYNKWKSEREEYTAKSEYDLDAAWAEIESLENQKRLQSEYDNIISTEMNKLVGKYGVNRAIELIEGRSDVKKIKEALAEYDYLSVEDIDNLLNEKTSYYNDAKRVQDEIAKEAEYNSVLSAEDFKQYTQIGAGVANPTWEDADAPLNILGWKPLGDGETITNMVTFAEENAAKANNESGQKLNLGGTSKYGELIYLINKHMKDDEKRIYNYYVGKGDTEKANEYLSYITDVLRQREGGGLALKYNDTFNEFVLSGIAGIDQSLSGFKNLDNFIKGTEGDPTSSLQYARGELAQDNEGIWKVANDLVNVTGNMLPSILVGTVTGGIGGNIALGISAAGNAYSEMRKLGYDADQARAYGTLTGASEAVLSHILGGISALGGGSKGIFQTIAGKIIPKLDKTLARLAITVGGNMLDEGLEEAIQEVLDPIFKAAVTGEDFEGINLENVLYSGLLGALSAGFLEGVPTTVGTAYNKISSDINAKRIYGNNASELVTESLELDPENAFAKKMQSKLDNGKKLSGSQLNRLVESNQNARTNQDKGKIKSAVEARLTELGETVDVAKLSEAIVKAQMGEKLTSAEKALFKESEYAERVYNELTPENIESGEYTSKWAENIGTEIINSKAYNKGLVTANTTTTGQAKTTPASKNTPTTEIATEGKIEVSEDSKVTIEKDGETVEVKPKSIASLSTEAMTLELESGEVVNVDEVDFGESQIGLVYQSAKDMASRVGGFSIDTANVFVRGYDAKSGQSAAEYTHGWISAYKFGSENSPRSLLASNPLTSKLTEAQRNNAYNFGMTFGKDGISNTSEAVSQTEMGAKRKGKVHFDGRKYGKTLNERQRASLKALNFLAEALGIDIYIVKSQIVNRKRVGANGKYDPQTHSIEIDLYAGAEAEALMLYTTAHELTHHIREVLPAKFNVLADAIFEEYSKRYGEHKMEDLIANKKAFLEEKGRTKNMSEEQAYDLAYEEVIADCCETMLTDSNAIEALSKNVYAKDKGLWETIKNFFAKLVARIKAAYKGANPDSEGGVHFRALGKSAERIQKLWVDALLEVSETPLTKGTGEAKYSYSSIAYSFFGDKTVKIKDFENGSYKETAGYKRYVDQCLNNMRQTIEGFNEESALKEIEDSIDGIVKVAVAMKKAGYDILDNHSKRSAVDSKNRLLFSSLEPNSDYFTSSDISTICDKRINFAEIYDEIVRREEALGVPKGKRFFDNVDNYFILHKIMADKGLTQPCRQCYVESMRKNLAPMANAFLELMQEKDPNNKANAQLYQPKGKNKGEIKSNNAKLRENLLEAIEAEEYEITADSLTVEMLTTEDGLAQLKLQAPLIYEAFNSFYGQSKPKMPKSATPFRFGELTALLTDNNGKIKKSLIDKIMSTGGFRLQSYSDFQVQNFADVLQVIFEAGTLGLSGHAYTKVPAFLDATKGTNLKRNISIFMYNDGGQWKIDRNDSFPYDLDKIYDIVKSDKSGNTSIIAVSQNEMMAAWIMANDNICYFIPFHKSGMKMGTVRETVVKEGGREIKGYSGIKDHTKQQSEVWAKNTADHKAYTKVKKGINIYDFWDFDNVDNLSKEGLIEKNVKAYIDACEEAGYLPKFREYVMNNSKVLNSVLNYSKQLGFVSQNATIDDISFEYKGYRIPYGYYKCLGDFGMFTPNGEASPIERLSLKDYNFAEAEAFFSDAETLRRNEILQQIANGEERERYRNSDMTTAEIAEEVQSKRNKVVEEVVSGEYKKAKYADRTSEKSKYSYEALTSKPNMKLATVGAHAPNNRADVVAEAKKNAAKVGKFNPKDGSVSVHVDDIDTDVLLGVDGLKHGLRRIKDLQDNANAIVTVKAGEIIKNSIRINELKPSKDNATGSYVLIGVAKNDAGDLYIVRSVVNQFGNELNSMDVLYAINAKKELAALNAPRSTAMPLSVTNSDISIAQLLDFVNKYFPDILPEPVWRHYGHTERPKGDLGKSALYSDRATQKASLIDTDSSYMDAVNKGDEESQQKIIDRSAKDAGYNSPMLYHGTTSFGFTEFDFAKSDDRISIFTSTDENVAKTYSGENARTEIKDRADITPEGLESATDEQILKYLKEHISKDFRTTSTEKYTKSARESIKGVKDKVTSFIADKVADIDASKKKKLLKIVSNLESLESATTYEAFMDAYDKYESSIWDLKWADNDLVMEVKALADNDLRRAYATLVSTLQNGDTAFTDGKKIITRKQAITELYPKLFSGVYKLYGRTANPLVIEGNGANWNQLDGRKIGKQGLVTTRDVVEYASQKGYDSVIFKDIVDNGDVKGAGASTVYAFLGEGALKSADPITYDDNGDVILPSERFNPNNNDIRYSDRASKKASLAPTFYSHMSKVIDDIKLEKMGASSILNHLKNRGVKDEEIKWSGIETFLEGKKSVTKAELQEFVAGSQLQIVEQMSGDDIDLRYDGSKRAYNLYDSNGEVIDTFTYNEFLDGYVAESDEEIYSNSLELTEALREEYGKTSAPSWEQYKIDGGTNYRELVFQLPNSTYSNRAMRGHWGQDAEGILVHARIQDFEVDGKKMLFIEELQSDWHNEGREKGYSTKEYEDAVAVYDKLANEYAKVRQAFNKYVRSSEFRSDPDEVGKKKFDWLRSKVDIAEKRMQDAERDVNKLKEKGMGDVQDAPFRDNYHEYVLKRLLRMAAEEGYDSIGWTIADTQSKRWSYDYEKAYQIEYDQEMPKFLRKYGKKWGTTVGKSTIADTEIWSMDISESMKDSVLYEGQVLYSDRVTKKATLDFLENQEHVTVYRAMQVIDGELYPPMAAKVKSADGKKTLVTPSKIGAWEQAVERPDLIRNGNKFELDKANGSSIQAAYNPYFHTSASPLNDQFSSAYKRPNLVIVEGEIPVSELTSGYRAEFAKDTVGETKWHSGPVASKLKGDKARRVFLSRWFKPVRIVPDSEVASIVAKTLEGENIEVPYNVVTPSLRTELENVGVPIKYQDRATDGLSNRSLLANALESAAQNDVERTKLQQYKEKIDLINSEQAKLQELQEKIGEHYRKKGQRDTEAIKSLQFEANQTANRINTYDRQLLNLESTKALKGVLEREKAQAIRRTEQKAAQRRKEEREKYRERVAKTQRELMTRYQESRRKGIESRNKTAMRHKIKDVVNELNNYLLKGTKDKHVPIELQKPVAEALDAVNMDTVGAEERIAKLKAEMMGAKTPEAIQEIAKKIEHIEEMGGNMEAKLSRLKTAYDSILNSEDPLVANSHDEVISNTIERVMDVVGNTPLRDMSLYQLEAVYDMYRMVLHSIRTANKAFKAKKSEEISVIANRVMEEVDKLGKKKKLQTKAGEVISSFDWNNEKPVYAFERIGSDTFTEVFKNVREGEDVWAKDMSEAQSFLEDQKEKYKYKSWDFKKRYEFTSSTGKNFSLSLGQIMSLYAYAKRGDQAKDHLRSGGFVFDELTEVKQKNKAGVEITYRLKDATAYNLSDEILADIISKLTDDQKAFADVMQDYLSSTMGDKGNEVSLQLYDVKLFKEKNYFPLKSAPQFLERAREQANGETKIKNKGFTKETTPKATNPIVLTSFMDVWAGHVNEMSMYHAFTLPLEDFYRVYNYKTPASETMDSESVISFLENAHGNASVTYIDQLLKDLNGSVRVDSTAGIINKLIGLFKKNAVFASASVVIQQPSAIARSLSVLDAKYFVGKKVSRGKHKEIWAEVKKYAPVAAIKEMGYFDTGMGKSSVEWLKGEKTWKDKFDDFAAWGPSIADELTWCAIWNAVKRETAHNNTKLNTNSEEFLKLVGERFTEVVTKTQVYDSVLSRSANMRSKDTGMKMATAFMAEPTTSLNMLQDALIQGKRGNKKYAAKTIGAVAASFILNAVLVSIVYAGRDDDEDETYPEKYLSTLVQELLDSFNPLTLIPFVKDIVSIAQGYDVERSDMAVITDLINAWNNLDSDNRSVYRKVEDFGGAIAALFGLPLKNVMRDVRGIYNTINSVINGEKTTGMGIANAIEEAVTGKEKSNGQQLYEAMLKGDTAQIERVKGRFEEQKDIDTALRKALRENDPRIKEAAEARYNGDIAEYMKIAKEIIAEGHFKQDDIVAAINSEITDIKKQNGEIEESTPSDKVVSLYKIEDYYAALVGRDDATAYAVKYDLIETDVANGKDRDEAEASFNSKFTSHIRDLYEEGEITSYNAKEMLINYGGKSKEEADSKVQYWDFKKEYPDYDLSEEAVKKYYSDVKPSGISVKVYYDYSKLRSKAKGTDLDGDGKTDSGSVKREVLQIINSLPISSYQKDALYYLNGWSQSTIWEAPWH